MIFLLIPLGARAAEAPRSELCDLLLGARQTLRRARVVDTKLVHPENWYDLIADCRARPSGRSCEDLVIHFSPKIFASARIFLNIFRNLLQARTTFEDLVQSGIVGLLSEVHNPNVDWGALPPPKQTVALAAGFCAECTPSWPETWALFACAGPPTEFG